MKWTLKLITELDSGETREHEVIRLERIEDFVKPASLGMSIDESKQIAAGIQTQMVFDQVDHHNKALTACRFCGKQVRTKGYYRSIFKSVFGKVPMRLRRVWGCECRGTQQRTFSSIPTGKNPTSPELSYLTAKLAALMPFGKVADLLGEMLPVSARTNASSVRNRTMRVGRRLERSAGTVSVITDGDGERKEATVSLDGAYVRGRNCGPERNFEVVVGKVLTDESATRFAFVREGTYSAGQVVHKAIVAAGCGDDVKITMMSDGDAGLRAIQQELDPNAEHILDWFHLAMRFRHISQVAGGFSDDKVQPLIKVWLQGKIDHAKWSFWNGKAVKGFQRLKDVDEWLAGNRQREVPEPARLKAGLLELTRYLNANWDSLPNYAKRYRSEQAISTAQAESAVNEIVAKRMVKKQQMRWNRHTVQLFLNVRVHVLNGTLEQTFRNWHKNFRPALAVA
jgi:hypothetical protein